MKWFFLGLLAMTFASADDGPRSLAGYDPLVDIISENYEAGSYLIYDCEEGHWTCVLESYYTDCAQKRKRDLASTKETHSCAPIGEFPTKKSCFQRQLFYTTHGFGQRFCMKDKWKARNLVED